MSNSIQASLRRRVKSGLAWNSVSVLLTFFLGLVRSIVLARLLMPDDYGLFGMTLTVTSGLTALTAAGLDISVISTKFKDDEQLAKHLNTFWTIELVRGLLLAYLLLAAAYPVSLFYRDNRLYTILLLVSLTPLVQGFNNIGLLIYRKSVRFQRIASIEITTNVLSTVFSILLAVWTRNVWALVAGQLVAAIVGVALSYVAHPYRPRPALDKEAVAQAMSFGKYAVLINALNYVMSMADNILIGKLFGAAVLGAYVVAYSLATLPVYALGAVVASVTLPAYAEMSGGADTRQLGRAFVRVFSCVSALVSLVATLFMLLAGEIVSLLYGERWAAAAPVLRILSLLVFCRGHTLLITPLIRSVRGVASDAGIKVVEAGIFLALLYPLTSRYGTVGAAYAASLAYFITLINRVRFAQHILPEVSKSISRTFLSAAAATVMGVALGAAAVTMVEGVVVRLALGGVVVTATVCASMLAMSPHLRGELSHVYSTFVGER